MTEILRAIAATSRTHGQRSHKATHPLSRYRTRTPKKESTMSPLLNDRCLVIGIASSALFDLGEGDRIFREQGTEEYEQYQNQHLDEPLDKGVAFPFISRLLSFNSVIPQAVEVIILSKNSPLTGKRVMRSIQHYGLDITRAVFRSGKSPFEFMDVFNMSLFLSANDADVADAARLGLAAGHVMRTDKLFSDTGKELRIAFDFDGVLADGSSDELYRKAYRHDPDRALQVYQHNESTHSADPIPAGPLKNLLAGINKLQQAERSALTTREAKDSPRLRVSLVTARNAPAHERALNTLESWGLQVDDAFFLGGLDKTPVLNRLRPHIFFDDQESNLSGNDLMIPAVHIPVGVENTDDDQQRE